MGTKTPYGLTSTGQRSTAYTPNMLSGLTNRMNGIGDAGGIMADSSPSVDTWDGIGRDPSLKTLAELAAEARERTKAAGGDGFNPNIPTLDELYASISDSFGGDVANQTYAQRLGIDALNRSQGYTNQINAMAAINPSLTAIGTSQQSGGFPATGKEQQEQREAAALIASVEYDKVYDTSLATIDAAAAVQQQDDDFQTRVNAAGGMNKGTIGLVIDAAQESFGDDTSRAIVTVIAEALKSGVTIDDLAAETGMTQAAIVAAAKDAGQDQDAKLSTQEIIEGGLDTAYDVVNSAIDLVEKGFEITGIEKLIDLASNTVAKVVGLDPSKASKVLTIDPTTGQITITASNQPGGGTGGYLPSSPQVTIGTTPGNTTYGTTTGNKVLTTIFSKIRNKGSLDASDVTGILGAVFEEVTGYNPSAVTGIVDLAKDGIEAVKKVINGDDDDDDNGTTAVTFGEGIPVVPGSGVAAAGPLPSCPEGQTQINEPGDCYVAPKTLADVTVDGGTSTSTQSPLPSCPEGQTQINEPGDCYVVPAGGGTVIDDDVCPPNTTLAGKPIPADKNCNPVSVLPPGGGGGTVIDDEVCPPNTTLAGKPIPADKNCNPVSVLPPPVLPVRNQSY